MNERIKELWSKAGGHYNSGNQHTWPEYTIDDPEKFAELIVRECAELFPLTFTDEQYQRRIDKTILKHFGVEK